MSIDEAPATRLIVNWLEVDADAVRVGATDDRRWRWAEEDGGAGADARTHVLVTLRAPRSGRAPEETVELFCAPDLPERALVLAELPDLTALAYALWRAQPTQAAAQAGCFGVPLPVALAGAGGPAA